jgi:hypothetical protein
MSIEDMDEEKPYEAFGGKAFPYLGWYWRQVDFDQPDYEFGVLPVFKDEFLGPKGGTIVLEENDKLRLGFMENNKWDYACHYCGPKAWQEIKRLLEIAVKDPTHDTLKAVDDKIQSLLEEG